MSGVRVQNDLVSNEINKTVQNGTQEIMERVVEWDSFSEVCDDITAAIISDLEENSFMTQDLALNEKQKEQLKSAIGGIISNAKRLYKGKLENDKRTKEIVAIVKDRMKDSLEELLSGISYEVNRGAIISATAVSADSKNEWHNKIELRASKKAGDVTVPTSGVFISTNCVEIIKNSIETAEMSEEKETKAVSQEQVKAGANA